MVLLSADFRRPPGPVLMATALALAALVRGGAATGPFNPVTGTVLGLLATAPIIVIRRFPAAAIATVLTASAAFVVLGRMSWSVAAVVGWLAALAAAPVLLPRWQAVAAVAGTEAAVLLGAAGLHGNVTPWDATAAEALAVLTAWGAGEMLRARRQSARSQAAAQQQVRYLSERGALARERASIARELHDVVAHHVSMIAVRASTAPYAVSGLPAGGETEFAEIAAEARAALAELRLVLGVLRTPEGAAETGPQPRLADLDALLARVSSAGTDVALTVTGPRRALPAAVELCGYRIVQEALTNAGRHAPGSRVQVALGYQQAALSVRIGNGPLGAEPGAALVPPGGAAGFGLIGLAERVEALGGSFQAAPEAGGGFAVTALLPALAAAPVALPVPPVPAAPPAPPA